MTQSKCFVTCVCLKNAQIHITRNEILSKNATLFQIAEQVWHNDNIGLKECVSSRDNYYGDVIEV